MAASERGLRRGRDSLYRPAARDETIDLRVTTQTWRSRGQEEQLNVYGMDATMMPQDLSMDMCRLALAGVALDCVVEMAATSWLVGGDFRGVGGGEWAPRLTLWGARRAVFTEQTCRVEKFLGSSLSAFGWVLVAAKGPLSPVARRDGLAGVGLMGKRQLRGKMQKKNLKEKKLPAARSTGRAASEVMSAKRFCGF